MTSAFAENDGGRPRILVAKMGQDGHDRGQKIIASAFADLGFEVEIGPLFATPEEIAALAAQKRVHIVGVSSLAAGHLALAPALKAALAAAGLADALVVVGGVIPEQDFAPLRAAGVDAIFPPGTVIAEAALDLLERLNQQLGYVQRGVAGTCSVWTRRRHVLMQCGALRKGRRVCGPLVRNPRPRTSDGRAFRGADRSRDRLHQGLSRHARRRSGRRARRARAHCRRFDRARSRPSRRGAPAGIPRRTGALARDGLPACP
jgi:methylmalonyl-CoA mutase cobalamin-binding domain/chain